MRLFLMSRGFFGFVKRREIPPPIKFIVTDGQIEMRAMAVTRRNLCYNVVSRADIVGVELIANDVGGSVDLYHDAASAAKLCCIV